MKHKLLSIICVTLLLSGCGKATEPLSNESVMYITSGTYHITADLKGQVITSDGNVWDYSQTIISNKPSYHGEPVYVAFDDNGTPNDIYDDVILGLTLDRETEIYNELEASLSESFELERNGNNIRIQSLK